LLKLYYAHPFFKEISDLYTFRQYYSQNNYHRFWVEPSGSQEKKKRTRLKKALQVLTGWGRDLSVPILRERIYEAWVAFRSLSHWKKRLDLFI